jgi:hypothetical protein
MVNEETQSNDKTENLWNSILVETSRSLSDRMETRTVLLLGSHLKFL